MPVSKRITWGSKDTLSDPRLADLDKHVNNIRQGRPSLEKGGKDGIFQNKDGDLPAKPDGYYSEYYVTKKASGQERDKLRLVLGKGDEIYITGDHYHDFRQIIGMPLALKPVPGEKEKKRAEAVKKIKDEIERLQRNIAQLKQSHKTQLDLMNDSFAGFWTNKLFNSEVPLLMIWNNAELRVEAALVAAQNGNLKKANSEFQRANLHYKIAANKYLHWKEGIEVAGTKMKYAIGGVAVALIGAAVLAFAATAAAGAGAGAAAATGTSAEAAEATLLRVAATVARADAVLLRVEVISAAEEVKLLEEMELILEEAERMTIW